MTWYHISLLNITHSKLFIAAKKKNLPCFALHHYYFLIYYSFWHYLIAIFYTGLNLLSLTIFDSSSLCAPRILQYRVDQLIAECIQHIIFIAWLFFIPHITIQHKTISHYFLPDCKESLVYELAKTVCLSINLSCANNCIYCMLHYRSASY